MIGVARRGLVCVGLATIVVAFGGCDAGTTSDVPSGRVGERPAGQSAPRVSDEDVTRLPRQLTSAVGLRRGLPASFPADLDRLAEFEASPDASVWLTYRPREALKDGSGWSSETIALWTGSWTKLSLGRLGIPEELWPGGDMLGSGALDDTGTQLAFGASSGVIVVHLPSGRWRSYLEGAGEIGSIRWYPGGKHFIADPWKGRDKLVTVRTGKATDLSAPSLALGFRENGDVVTLTRRGDRDLVRDTRGSNIAELPANPRQRGRFFASWWSGDHVAYSNYETVGGRYALRVASAATDGPVATLTWSRRTGAFLRIHGWWDEQRILLSMDRSLVTWAPETGALARVAALPRSDVRLQHASVGIAFRQPRPTARSSSR